MRSAYWLCLFSLILCLQACSPLVASPPQSVIERGLALKMAQAQQTLMTHLAPRVPQLPNIKLRRVNVTLREDQPSDTYHIQGTYQAIVQLNDRPKKQSGPFELYLAKKQTEDLVSWYLLSNKNPNSQQTLLIEKPR